MHQIRNVEANTAIPPMYSSPILPQPQPQPTIHSMNPPANNNLMVMLSHMQQQQQQQQQHQQQQHFNHVRKVLFYSFYLCDYKKFSSIFKNLLHFIF